MNAAEVNNGCEKDPEYLNSFESVNLDIQGKIMGMN